MSDPTDSYDVTADADQAHDDKWLADAVIALGVGTYLITGHPMQPDHQYEISGQTLPPYQFVTDWRVAGALMEKCATVEVDVGENDWRVIANDSYDAWNKSLPRAIIEACCEALK